MISLQHVRHVSKRTGLDPFQCRSHLFPSLREAPHNPPVALPKAAFQRFACFAFREPRTIFKKIHPRENSLRLKLLTKRCRVERGPMPRRQPDITIPSALRRGRPKSAPANSAQRGSLRATPGGMPLGDTACAFHRLMLPYPLTQRKEIR